MEKIKSRCLQLLAPVNVVCIRSPPSAPFSKLSLLDAAPDSKGPLCPICTHLSVLVAGMIGKRVEGAFLCSAPTHPAPWLWVLGATSPNAVSLRDGRRRFIQDHVRMMDGQRDWLVVLFQPQLPPPTPLSLINPALELSWLLGRSSHVSKAPTPPDLIPCTPRWCSPP